MLPIGTWKFGRTCRPALPAVLMVFLPVFGSVSTLQRDDGLVGGLGILSLYDIYG
jgi:hypothetical protein